MSENLFPLTDSAATIHRHGKLSDADKNPMIRVYRYSPDRVMLQIRTQKSYASATLSFEAAKQIAAALVAESE